MLGKRNRIEEERRQSELSKDQTDLKRQRVIIHDVEIVEVDSNF